jgi:hypothetical protein
MYRIMAFASVRVDLLFFSSRKRLPSAATRNESSPAWQFRTLRPLHRDFVGCSSYTHLERSPESGGAWPSDRHVDCEGRHAGCAKQGTMSKQTTI